MAEDIDADTSYATVGRADAGILDALAGTHLVAMNLDFDPVAADVDRNGEFTLRETLALTRDLGL